MYEIKEKQIINTGEITFYEYNCPSFSMDQI